MHEGSGGDVGMSLISAAKKREFHVVLSRVRRYQLLNAIYLTTVPLICAFLLVLLIFVFARLNLYYLESNGLIVNDEVREAYFDQVNLVVFGELWYFAGLLVFTFILSMVVMFWATAPFVDAEKLINGVMEKPDSIKPSPKWLSESLVFDRFVWLFALQVKNRKSNDLPEEIRAPRIQLNFLFLAKFLACFSVISIVTGYALGILLTSIYEKIVDLALHLVQNAKVISHYFLAQQEILQDATTLLTVISLVVYLLLGLHISRYMSTMTFVFARAIKERRFPIYLRSYDVYHSLANTLSVAYNVIAKGKDAG